jgi:DNA integrity scanning protein DisA with diadenylate cyclase activity
LISIFIKESPLHDGAVIIFNDRIKFASAILPVSDNKNLPRSAGLRHRAAVGVSENTSVLALIVSEETGQISYAQEGRLFKNVDVVQLENVIDRYFNT